MGRGPLFCAGVCCEASGVFDWYGPSQDLVGPLSDLFYRSASMNHVDWVPVAFPFYSSLDATEPWSVDYFEGGVEDEGKIYVTLAPYGTSTCWALRNFNESHPDSGLGDELISNAYNLGSWTEGADADYIPETGKLQTTTADPTPDAYILTGSIPDLEDGVTYRLGVLAKQGETRYLELKITNVDTATPEVGIIDLLGHAITGGTAVPDSEADFYYYELTFTAVTPDPGSVITVRLCAAAGADLDEPVDAGSYVSFVSLRKIDFVSPGYDISKINASSQTVTMFEYISRIMPATNFAASFAWFAAEYEFVSHEDMYALPALSRTAELMTEVSPYGSGLLGRWASTGNLVRRCWADSGGFGSLRCDFYQVTSTAITWPESQEEVWINPPGISVNIGGAFWLVADIYMYYTSAGTIVRKVGFNTLLNCREYPIAAAYPIDRGGEIVVVEDPNNAGNDWWYMPVKNGDNTPKIVGVSPHGWPNVWAIAPARQIAIPYVEPVDYVEVWPWALKTVTTTSELTFGPIVTENITTNIGETLLFNVTGPIIRGSDTVVHSVSSTQTQPTRFENSGYFSPIDMKKLGPYCWIGLAKHDANGDSGIAFLWEAKVFITNTLDALEISGYAIDVVVEYTAFVKTGGGGTLWSGRIWRDDEVFGGVAARCSTVGIAGDGSNVWTERRYSVAPTEGDPGTPKGWRLHCGSWYIDNDEFGLPQLECDPEFVQSSDRHIFMRNFYMCDTRMIDQIGYNWAFSLDGQYMWPISTVDDNDLHISRSLAGISFDCIKSSSIPLCPAVDEWPSKAPTWRTMYNEAIGSIAQGADVDYTAGKLQLNGPTVASTDAALYPLLVGGKLFRYRITIAAKAVELDWLLFRWVDFAGTGDDVSAWMNTNTGAFGATDNVALTDTDDLGGGVTRFYIEIQRPLVDDMIGQATLRLVNANSAEDVDGDAPDGIEISEFTMQAQCLDIYVP